MEIGLAVPSFITGYVFRRQEASFTLIPYQIIYLLIIYVTTLEHPSTNTRPVNRRIFSE